MIKKATVVALIMCALNLGLTAQKKMKPWSDWSDKEAQKILDDSAWGQTQIETDTSEMFYSPSTQAPGGADASRRRGATTGVFGSESGNNRVEEGALNQPTSVKFQIRFLSAKPIRQALARQISLKQRVGMFTPQLRTFVEGSMGNRVVVAVNFETTDQRFGGKVMQAFNSATTAVLRNSAYLERKDGKRIFLQDYIPPTQNTLGAAMFVFPRTVGDRPLLEADSGEVRFVSEFAKNVKLNMRYKVADMMYEGKLEY